MTRAHRCLLTVVALTVVSSCEGCFGCTTSPVDAPESLLPRNCLSDPPLLEPQKLEILFVIDNSNSMIEEQAAVARELTAFIEQIQKAGGVRQDFHVGVVTTSVYQHLFINRVDWFRTYPEQAGRLRPVPDFLEDGGIEYETGNQRMLTGDDPALLAKFGKLVQQGVTGSGHETPFEAVRLALLSELAVTPMAQGGNQEFLRDGSRVLVVVLTDEDDCSETARPSVVRLANVPTVADCTDQANSLSPTSEYHRLFTTQFVNADGSPRDLIWTAIAPVAIGSKAAMAIVDEGRVKNVDCPTSNQAGFRHREMAERFDLTLTNLDSICRDSFRQTLIRIAELASVSQTLEVRNLPDERMLQVAITRKDGSVENCTLANQGLTSFTRGTNGAASKIMFGNQCRRRADDSTVQIKLLCAT
jgi:hypothetical protein